MVDGKTKSGFKYKIDERMLNDWRLLKLISLSESKDASEQIYGASNLVTLLLGDQEQALMEHIAKINDGFVPASAVTDIVAEIMTDVKEIKNS